MNGKQLKSYRDHATKEEVIEFKKEKIRELMEKINSILTSITNEIYTPIGNKYLSRKSSRYLELEHVYDKYLNKYHILNDKYLALCRK